ncbi:MAG: hypothetical protein MI723_05665, partial [Caulobacterales bacterium]|nr:hypothetical protein [Caulobacterales bacterium]
QGAALAAARTALWGRIVRACGPIGSVAELGANVGLNLIALRRLLPEARLTAVEINATAASRLRELDGVEVLEGSLLEVGPAPADLAFTCTVLIHIAPAMLPRAYDRLARAAGRYAVICEYYNPTPVTAPYRGHADRLFKRDFAGEFLDAHPAFRLRDYGFIYHRDPNFPADDFTWFLLERTG